jgi:hypothetical protein
MISNKIKTRNKYELILQKGIHMKGQISYNSSTSLVIREKPSKYLHAYTERFLFSPNVSNDSKQR